MVEYKDFGKLENLDELKDAIQMGMDIEFVLYATRYNISWRNEKPFICRCPDGSAIYYNGAQELLDGFEVHGRKLKELWTNMEILSM